MIPSAHLHPQLVTTLLTQPPQSAHLIIQSHLPVSTQYSCTFSIAVCNGLTICSLLTHGGSQTLQCIELCLHCTVCFPLTDTSDNSTTSGPRLASSQSPSTPPSGGPVSPTTSVGSSNHSVTPTCEYTALMYIKYSSWYLSIQVFVLLTHGGRQILQ